MESPNKTIKVKEEKERLKEFDLENLYYLKIILEAEINRRTSGGK